MKTWKILFWISLILLILSNLFWVYQIIDTAVGHGYEQVSCEEYKANSDILKAALHSFTHKNELTAFLAQRGIEFETLHKADNENYIIIGNLDILFLDNGKIVMEHEQ